MSYNERGRSVHADDGAIDPAKKPLHYQLDVASGRTLHRENSLRYDRRLQSCCRAAAPASEEKEEKPACLCVEDCSGSTGSGFQRPVSESSASTTTQQM